MDKLKAWYCDTYETQFSQYLAKIRVLYYQWGKLPQFLLLNFVAFFIGCVQILTWRINGVKNHLKKIRKIIHSKSADLLEIESAQVFKVWSVCKPSPFDKFRRAAYLTTHETFCKPGYVLASDKVVLAEVTDKKAIFVQLKQPIDRYTVEKEPFFYNALFNEAETVIEMPLEIFFQLADSVPGGVGGSWTHVTFLFNGGRCGSTVMARMVQEADFEETIVLSEPPVFIDLVWNKILMPEGTFRKTMRCVLAVFLKPMCNKKKIVVKMTYFISCIAEDFHQALPTARFIYSHRDPMRLILAHERAFGQSPICLALLLILHFDLWMWARRVLGFHSCPKIRLVINEHLKSTMFDVCLIVWADGERRYREQSAGFYYPILSYDDLLENPTDFCKRLLHLVDIDPSRLDAALAALAKDSQEATVLSRDVLRHLPVTPYSVELEIRSNKYCDALNLPRLNFDLMKSARNGFKKHEINGFYVTNSKKMSNGTKH